ncbi:hypothetical protein D5S17_17160 [Pseudonocardiaceae bacterium YIM PH 21723]|nr:hypothetical protein D5S17_17160 [Pseudonocardiaceae bacterium YIM PH 21723]
MRRVHILGAGPAGLYLAILLRKANPATEVIVTERNAPDATFGFGVVFSEETLGALRTADPQTYTEITDTFARWDRIDIRYRDRTMSCRGNAFSAIARIKLLRILQNRATELGAQLRFHTEIEDVSALREDADLVIAADGVNSILRRTITGFDAQTGTVGSTYVWFGSDWVPDAFTFIFKQTEHGLFQVHSYPYDEHSSTFIVETTPETWRKAGLDQVSEVDSMAFCQHLFAEELAGHTLRSNRSLWQHFPKIVNSTWSRENVVLIGDAAHTAHFSIGSGTKLAMEDAISLAAALENHSDLRTALVEYELDRKPIVERFQQAAGDSAAYFQRTEHLQDLEPPQFAFNLLTRSGRIGHGNLAQRDPGFVRSVDNWLHGKILSPPPLFTPLELGGLSIGNRVVAGSPETGAGLVIGETVAVTGNGRIHPGSPTLADAGQWPDLVESVHKAGALLGLRLGHAGRRGATHPPQRGRDIPLPADQAWPLISATDQPYGPRSQAPTMATEQELQQITAGFTEGARLAADAGVDLLELDMAHGYLLAAFLHTEFPFTVLEAVRAEWPVDRPLSVRLTVTDYRRGGLSEEDGIALAARLKAGGVDLITVTAGQSVHSDQPPYRRGYLTALSARVRSEANVATLVGGYLTTTDEVNTIIAAGRADLCFLEGA